MQNKNIKGIFIFIFVFLLIAIMLFLLMSFWQSLLFLPLIFFCLVVLPIIYIFDSLRIITGSDGVVDFILSCFMFLVLALGVISFSGHSMIILLSFFILIEIAIIKVFEKNLFFAKTFLFYLLVLSISFFVYTLVPHLFQSMFAFFYFFVLIVYLPLLLFCIFLSPLFRKYFTKSCEQSNCREINSIKQLIEICWSDKRRQAVLSFLFVINIIFSIYLFYLFNTDATDLGLFFFFSIMSTSIFITFLPLVSFLFMSVATINFKENIKVKINFIIHSLLFSFFILFNSLFLLKILEKILSFF